MNRKMNIVILIAVFFILLVNYFFTKNRITNFFDEKNIVLGMITIIAVFVGSIAIKIVLKKTLKPNVSYEPKMLWVIGVSAFLGGIYMMVSFLLFNLMDVTIDAIYTDIVFQLIISAILAAIIYDLFYFFLEYPKRKAIKDIERADQLVKEGAYKDALNLYEGVPISKKKNIKIYAWICQSKGVCYLELSKLQDKKTNIIRAIKEFEEVIAIKELQDHLGNIKFKLGELYHELAEMDYRAEYLIKASKLFEDAMKYFSGNEGVDSYMTALNNIDKIKMELAMQQN